METPEQNTVVNLPQAKTEAETAVPQQQVPAQSGEPAASGESVFETKNVSIYYGDFRAVTDVSLTIHENEITAFIGPSGCGKTTVLRTLNRMNDLVVGARVEGDVNYRGASLYTKEVSPIAVCLRIGMVFQKPNPFPKSIFPHRPRPAPARRPPSAARFQRPHRGQRSGERTSRPVRPGHARRVDAARHRNWLG